MLQRKLGGLVARRGKTLVVAADAPTRRAALARWVGTHRSQITRAARGQELGGEEGWRLAGLAAVVTALLAIYEPEAVSGWLQGNNPHLGDRRPLDVLAEGDVAAVMAAIQAARTGVYA
jgi:uncharacterized protein (DUF2384 family)